MKQMRIRGKLSIVWILALAALLYTGIKFVRDAENRKEAAAEAFASGSTYEPPNTALTDLLR